jgi:hypothetical protein
MWSRLWASVSHCDGPIFLLCVSVCGPVYWLVYPIVMGLSSCCVCLYVVPSMGYCIPLWWADLPVVCVCMWSRLWASVSHCDGPLFLLWCICMWSRLWASVSYCDGPLFLLWCICMWSRLWASVSCCDVSARGPVYGLVYPAVMYLHVVPSMG